MQRTASLKFFLNPGARDNQYPVVGLDNSLERHREETECPYQNRC
jgi:hypothetical protein